MRLLWVFSVLYLFICLRVSSLSPQGVALLGMSRNLTLPSSIKSSWNESDATPCSWEGISCDLRDNVVSVALWELGISGALSPEIGRLRFLKTLDFGTNNLTGQIPSELGNCTHLDYLNLSNNLISGGIPESLGNLRKLKYFSLFGNMLSRQIPDSIFLIPGLEAVFLNQNNLSGRIPPTLGNSSRLKSLWLYGNSLSGVIPDSIGNCTLLEDLYLSENQLVGSLPQSFYNLGGLVELDISQNSLEGAVPFGSGNCRNLTYLVLSFNLFSGELPGGLGNCTSLQVFAANDNSLFGPIPSSFGSLSQLSELYLSDNFLAGPIPSELGKCQSLEMMEINTNQLQGVIPSELGKLRKLRSLSLFSNCLHGEVPRDIWRIPTLENLQLYNNNLSGVLPVQMTELKKLKNISLYNNHFYGDIPHGLGINSSLEIVDLTNNSLTGTIPPSICFRKRLSILNLGCNLLQGSIPLDLGKCPRLRRLILKGNNLSGILPDFSRTVSLLRMDISGNNISGPIPSSLGTCMNVTLIDLSRNMLKGPIPRQIGKLQRLEVLNLSRNYLEGQVPSEISQNSKLFMLDVGYNLLNGTIPSNLANLTLLAHLILSDNQFTGGVPDFFSRSASLLELQIGGNMLGGQIPPSLGGLKSLAIALNLSHNGLTGEVPSELRMLNKLQILDISSNNLQGALTPLGDLNSLLGVNISFNQFSGPIPIPWLKFLDSSPSSFFGNPGLCITCHPGSSACRKSQDFHPCAGSGSRGKLSAIAVAMVALGSSLFCLLLLGLGVWLCCSKGKDKTAESELSSHDGSSFLLQQVLEATDNLNERYLIGRGAHGAVYKVSLGPEKVYAAKKVVFSGKRGADVSMIREIKTVGSVRHRNLIKLEEFWLRQDHGLILYNYMENGSLHDVLHGNRQQAFLPWGTRHRIALGTAQGLAYLHNDCNPTIMHRDIKPMNILLDADMEPHISDFGIATLIDQSSASLSSSVIGTIGYISPETAFTTKKSKESDVYSYGVVLLELITRKKALDPSIPNGTDIVSWVIGTSRHGEDPHKIVDSDLRQEFLDSTVFKGVSNVLLLALRCTSQEAGNRPTMRDVVKLLTDAGPQNARIHKNPLVKGSPVGSTNTNPR